MVSMEVYAIADLFCNGINTNTQEEIGPQPIMAMCVKEVRYEDPEINNTRVQVEHEVNEQKMEEEAEEKARAEAEAKARAEAEAKARAKAEAKAKEEARKKAEEEKQRKKREIENLKKFYNQLNEDTDMTKKIGLSKNTYEKILKTLPYDYVGFFQENAAYMWEIARKKNLNEFLVVGIIANESCWAQDPVAENNFSSQRIGNSNSYYEYATAEKGIQVVADSLSTNYLNPKGKYYNGTSLQKINELYCEPLVREDGSVEKYGWAEDTAVCIRMVIREYLKTLE